MALHRAVRYALFVGAAVVAAPSIAAESSNAGATTLEEIVVTGSMIPQNMNAPGIPVTVLSSEDILASGAPTDVLDVLKKTQPGFFGGLNVGSENGNVSSGSTNGGSQVALRNRSTLVLINGRRAAISPVAASGGFNFVDVSMIPTSAVERIEVLADGASATYGADAVGGVVNLILKSDFEGVEVGGRYGFDDDGYEQRSAYATMGGSNGTTSITFSANWQKNDPLIQADRAWGSGQFRSPTYAGVINIGTTFYYLNPSLNAPPTGLNLTPAELIAQGIYQGPLTQTGAAQFFDLSLAPTMLIASERRSAVLSIEHEISDAHTLFSDVMVTNSFTSSRLNAQPVASVVAAATASNPFDTSVTARNRFIEFPRVYDTDTTGWRGVLGVRGDLVGTWQYEVAANWNRTTAGFINNGLIEAAPYTAAVASGAYNPFARQQAPGVIESFLGASFENYVSSLYTYDAAVFGEIFDLPAGPVQLAIGAQTAREELSFTNDRLAQTGGWLQATPTLPFSANQESQGYYAEVRVPVFSDANAIPGFQVLEVSLAARKVVYDTTDEDPTVPKVTFRWQPFGDTFAVRGSVSESFTAPTLYELFGPTGAGFTNGQQVPRYDTAGNPLGVSTGSVQFRQRTGANPDLDPATSDNFSFGVEWMPSGALSGFSVGLDYYSIKEEDIVSTVPSSSVLQNVERLGTASPFANLVRLGQSVAGELRFTDGDPITTPGQITNRPSDEVWLSLLNINLASIDQEGLDLKLGYVSETGRFGQFSAQLTANYLLSYDQDLVPGVVPVEDLAGVYDDDFGMFPDWRAVLSLGWEFGPWSAGINGTFLPSVDDVTFGAPFGKVDSYSAFDLRFGYNFAALGPDMRVSLMVNNVTNEDPPFIDSESNQGRDIATYDPIGRFYALNFSYRF